MTDTYHSVAARCKICSKPLVLKIADCYDELSDAAGLIPMATCDYCYDLRQRRNKWIGAIERACIGLIMLQGNKNPKSDGVRENLKEILKKSTMEFAKVFAEFHKSPRTIWDDETAMMFYQNPNKWEALLNGYRNDARKFFREHKPNQTHPDA